MRTIRAKHPNQKSVLSLRVDFWPRFSPKINPNFFSHVWNLKDYTLVYHPLYKWTWDAHGPLRYRSILWEKSELVFSNFHFVTSISPRIDDWRKLKHSWMIELTSLSKMSSAVTFTQYGNLANNRILFSKTEHPVLEDEWKEHFCVGYFVQNQTLRV